MIDHVSLGCSNFERSIDLYRRLLETLGYGLTEQTGTQAGFGRPGEQSFYLYPQTPDAAIAGAGTHVAFSAGTVAEVDRFAAIAAEDNLTVLRPAGRRPDISPFYYGTVLRDLDGNMLEAVVYVGP